MSGVRSRQSTPTSPVRRCARHSTRPTASSSERSPSDASRRRTSSATNRRYACTISGVPPNFSRSSGRWVAMPTGQLSRWHERTMRQPSARRSDVPNAYSSAPSSAATTTSRPVLKPPSARSRTRLRRWFATSACCASASPSSHGTPALLIETSGLAPVPPSAPAMWMTSACAFATPAATRPTPLSATSFTEIAASGFTSRRSKTSWARSSIE